MRGNAKNLPFTHSNSDFVRNLTNERIDAPKQHLRNYRRRHFGRYSKWIGNCITRDKSLYRFSSKIFVPSFCFFTQ